MTALELIDRALAGLVGRRVVSAGEVTDLLLDLRGSLTGAALYSPVAVGRADPSLPGPLEQWTVRPRGERMEA